MHGFARRLSWIALVALVAHCALPTGFNSRVLGAEKSGEWLEVSDMTFTPPAGWKAIRPASPMRKAQFEVRRDGIADPAEVVFFYFGPGGAGGTQANIKRWYGQFKEPESQLATKVETLTVDGVPVSLVSATGSFLSGPPLGQKVLKADYALQGAILEAPGGHIFIKMTGPKDLVQDALEEFRSLVESARKARK